MTCLGINNEGHMVFDYYHEDTDKYITSKGLETNVYNGQESVLWVKFREAFADEISACYKQLREDKKLTKEVVLKYFVEDQSNKWAASIYNEDSDYKYIAPVRFTEEQSTIEDPKTNGYLYQVRGTGEHHLEYFLNGRLNYCDSKWETSTYTEDRITVRINTPDTISSVTPCADITVTPFSKMYAGVMYNANDASIQKKLLDKNETHTFKAPASNEYNDTDSYILGASQLSSIGDLSPLYCNYCNISKAVKLVDLKIGNEDKDYQSQLVRLDLGPNILLKRVDIRNCRAFEEMPNFEQCTSIEEIYAEGSNLTITSLPKGGYIKVLHLPATINTLNIYNHKYIEDFMMEGYNNIRYIIIENTPNLPIEDILLGSDEIQRLRLINIEWETTNDNLKKIIEKLENSKGFDANGNNAALPVMTGMVKVDSIDTNLLRTINDRFPELMVCVNGVVHCTVTYYNADGAKLDVRTVYQGSDAPDIAKEPGKEPKMEDTEKYRYKYKCWDKPLTNIQKSCSFIAMYETLYNVRFFVDGQVKYNVFAEYGSSIKDPILTNNMSVPVKESDAQYHYTFAEWNGEAKYVTEPIDIEAIFSTELRSYEIIFCDEFGVELGRVTCSYGTTPEYDGGVPLKQNVEYPQDYKFLGWIPELASVSGPATYKASFADSDHILDSWATVNASVTNGTYKTKYPLGILHRVKLKDDQLIDVELVAYDNGESKSGKKTGLTFMAKNCLKEYKAMSSEELGLNSVGWEGSPVREYLNVEIFERLFPDDLKKFIVCTINKTRRGGAGYNRDDLISTEDYLWLPSLKQVRQGYYKIPALAGEGDTFDYFDDRPENEYIKERRKRYNNAKIDSAHCYLRSPAGEASNYKYYYIDGSGDTSSYNICTSKKGIAPTFSIGEVNA